MLKPVGDGREFAHGAGGFLAGDAEDRGGHEGGFGVALVVRADEACLREGAGAGREECHAAFMPYSPGRRGERGRKNGRVAFGLPGEEVHFGVGVFLHVLVEVEMVLGNVEQNAHARMQGAARLKLEARELQHDDVGLRFAAASAEHVFGEGHADVAAREHAQTVGFEHGGTEARGGGLAARAGDADHGLAVEQPPGKFGFGHDFGLRAVFAHGQERLDHGLCRSGARNDEIHALKVGGSVFTAEDGHMVFIKPGGKIRGHLIRLLFEQAHVRAEFAQQTDGGATASACAYDGDAAMRKIKRTHDGILSEFENGKGYDGEKHGNDPEPDDDLGFRSG